MKRLLLAALMLVIASPAQAQASGISTGLEFLTECRKQNRYVCYGYISGFTQGYGVGFVDGVRVNDKDVSDYNSLLPICVPDNLTTAKITQQFMDYLTTIPNELHESTAKLLRIWMEETYSCDK